MRGHKNLRRPQLKRIEKWLRDHYGERTDEEIEKYIAQFSSQDQGRLRRIWNSIRVEENEGRS